MPRKPISFELDFMVKDIFPRFTVKQFDDVSFNIKPKNQGLDYDTTGMTGKIFVGINNDMFMQTTGITVSSDNINVLLDKNMLQKNGRAYAEIELTDDAGTITSSSFIFDIDPKIGEGGQIPGEYEGFVEKYERLISEFKSQVNSCTNNANNLINKTINNCNTNVNNKLNSVDNLVNIKISDFEKRFNRLTSSQQQSAEIIDARQDFKGNIYNSLKERIDATDKILRDSVVSTVETESDFTTVDATSNGYFEDVKLEGNTLVNRTNIFDKVNPGGGLYEKTSNSLIVNYNKCGELSEACSLDETDVFKSGRIYTIVIDILQNTLNLKVEFYPMIWDFATIISGTQYVNTGEIGRKIFVIKANKDYSLKLAYASPGHAAQGVTGLVEFKDIMVLDGDYTNKELPNYFEELKSVGQDVDEVSVESVKGDGNLFNCEVVDGFLNADTGVENNEVGSWAKTKTFIRICPSTKYYISSKKTSTYINAAIYYDRNKKYLGRSYAIGESAYILATTPINAHYVKLRFRNYSGDKAVLSDIQECLMVKSDSEQLYTPHQSNKKPLLYYNPTTETWEKPILRQWDSIEKHSDGKYYYHKRSREVVLDGNDNFGYWLASTQPADSTLINIYVSKVLNDGKNNGIIICDKFVNDASIVRESCYTGGSGNMHFVLPKTTFSDASVFKAWLQTNPTTVVYQLAQEEVYECTSIDLITYEGETNYIVNTGAITPKSTLKVHSNISNVVKILQEKVSLLESNVKASQEVQDMMILESDIRILDMELALMEHMPIKLNLGENSILRSVTYFNFLKNHIVNGTYSKDYLENVMNKYLATNRLTQEEYDELYKMLYPPIYDIALPIE